MGDVHQFSSQDTIEEEASEWLARLDSEIEPSQKELEALGDWINRSPTHRAELTRLAQFWDNANILAELSIPLYHKQNAVKKAGFWNALSKWQTYAAAAVILIGLISAPMMLENDVLPPGVSGNGVYETRIGEQNTITLVDGSIIELNTNSHIQVDYTSDHRAITLLQGEAHFDVSKQPNRPFEVYAGQGRVSAVGTAFSVRLQQQFLKVTVTEGKVKLAAVGQKKSNSTHINSLEAKDTVVESQFSAGDDAKELGALDAGQTVLFRPVDVRDVSSAVKSLDQEAMEQQLAWREGLLLFTGETLTEVVNEISRYTTANIEIVDPAIANIRIGGQFRVGETDYMLKVLSSNFDIEAYFTADETIQLRKRSSKS